MPFAAPFASDILAQQSHAAAVPISSDKKPNPPRPKPKNFEPKLLNLELGPNPKPGSYLLREAMPALCECVCVSKPGSAQASFWRADTGAEAGLGHQHWPALRVQILGV